MFFCGILYKRETDGLRKSRRMYTQTRGRFSKTKPQTIVYAPKTVESMNFLRHSCKPRAGYAIIAMNSFKVKN